MKRRDFLTASAGLAATGAFQQVAWAQSPPCPPPALNVAGGSSTEQTCGAGAPADAEADWLTRRTGPGVVWAHDFRYPEELGAFLTRGDPKYYTRTPTIEKDGPTGYCLQYLNPAGASTESYQWGRIMSPVHAHENGLPYDDPASSGQLIRRHWTYGSRLQDRWGYGFYGHQAYHAAFPNWGPPEYPVTGTNAWDGSEFYLQFRVKMSASRFSSAQRDADGQATKIMFIDTNVPGTNGLHNQQLIMNTLNAETGYPPPHEKRYYRTARMNWATNQGNAPDAGYQDMIFSSTQGRDDAPETVNPGGEWASTCKFGSDSSGYYTAQADACWEWPVDKWVTVHVYLKPGRHNQLPAPTNDYRWMQSAPYRETEMAVQVHVEGDAPVYRTIYRKSDLVWIYGDLYADDHLGGSFGKVGQCLPGFNRIMPTAFANLSYGTPAVAETYWHRFTQIILSRRPIPCPTVRS